MKNFIYDLLEVFYEIRETFANFDRKQWLLTYLLGLIFMAIVVFSIKTEPPVPLEVLKEQTNEQKNLHEAIPIPQIQIEEGGRPNVTIFPTEKKVLPLKTDATDKKSKDSTVPISITPPPSKVISIKQKNIAVPKYPRRHGKKYKIAIVIDDVGLSNKKTKEAIALPDEINLSFLPYGSNVEALVNMAFEVGHEIWVHVPMESRLSSVDSGRGTLKTTLPPYEIRHRLDWNLSQFGNYIGINNHMGSGFTANTEGMRIVMSELKKRHLLFLDSRTTSETVGEFEAFQAGVPCISRNIFLDNIDTMDSIQRQLDKTENYAIKHGVAVAIGHPRTNTLKAIAEWTKNLDYSRFELSKLSTLISERYK